ncbi:uncharacterized protein UV8b_01672 [Ustilaginoidea virens]|uniref:Extracellular membrane protein CFEM domain-containing protein n=1 Tax=Ustilaginoidea virens TaxID=1159556 RepID=A0A8E5MEL7_USTVR|nr:uncharacterized protein UV8b_01672 [Ustilaginoidea virens]QUC17431.1 hypothetical protein UV8b_01672 [Ustilaginoidea virens]
MKFLLPLALLTAAAAAAAAASQSCSEEDHAEISGCLAAISSREKNCASDPICLCANSVQLVHCFVRCPGGALNEMMEEKSRRLCAVKKGPSL